MTEFEKQNQTEYTEESQNHGPYPNGPQYNQQWNNGPYPNEPQYNQQWNNGPYPNEPYKNPYNPYQRNPKKKNGFATAALASGIFALLNLCCFNFTSCIILGVGAISVAIISKKGEPMTKTAVAAVVLGAIAIVLGVVEFFYSLWLSDLLKDPDNIAMFNQMFEQIQNELAAQTSAAAQ